jgi:hypothetical protein
MKQGCTHISFVLDRSGSMQFIADDTIGGFNSFLADQKALPGSATFSLLQFDDQFETIHRNADLQKVNPLDRTVYIPRGCTALRDAIGRMINLTGADLAAKPSEEHPEKVIMVILTDGFENASHEFTMEQINEMISHQRDVYKWQFVFLGANQDAIAEASKYGINADQSLTFAATGGGARNAFKSVSDNISYCRIAVNRDAIPRFSQQDRLEQEKEIKKQKRR